MATEGKDQGRAQDRRKVAGGQDHEVRQEAEKMDVSRDEVRAAVRSEGNSRAKVERKLKEQAPDGAYFCFGMMLMPPLTSSTAASMSDRDFNPCCSRADSSTSSMLTRARTMAS